MAPVAAVLQHAGYAVQLSRKRGPQHVAMPLGTVEAPHGGSTHSMCRFQFTLIRAAGYDVSEGPKVILISPYTLLNPAAGAVTATCTAAFLV